MPWRKTNVMDQRVEFVVKAGNGVGNFSGVCREFGISRPTGYKWLERYRETGSMNGLRDLSRRPGRSPSKTHHELESMVIALRVKYGWGAKKLKVLLAREGIDLCVSTINRIIKRNDLLEPDECHRPAVKRFEMDECNELWQMDFKGEWKIEGGWCYPLSILDDHSRYAIVLHPMRNQSYNGVYGCLNEAFRTYGVPRAMLMDHGVPWWNGQNRNGLTRLSVHMIHQGIRLIYSGMGHPQTQGKVERFHRTLKKSIDRKGRPKKFGLCRRRLAEFHHEYNNVRPHEALEMATPSARYARSKREYNPNPPDWEYPRGSRIVMVNSQGSITYGGRRYFVSAPLAGERVRIVETDRGFLVNYRHMYVREIDPETRRTPAVVLPVSGHQV